MMNPRAFSEEYKLLTGLPKLRAARGVVMRVPSSLSCEGSALSLKPDKV